jgi:hypothetical protein
MIVLANQRMMSDRIQPFMACQPSAGDMDLRCRERICLPRHLEIVFDLQGLNNFNINSEHWKYTKDSRWGQLPFKHLGVDRALASSTFILRMSFILRIQSV